MELRDLRYFLVLVDELHFRRASRRLFITPSSLSKSISRLERSLRVELMERSPRQVRLTLAGEQVAAAAEEVVRAAERLERVAAEHRSPPVDRLGASLRALATDQRLLVRARR